MSESLILFSGGQDSTTLAYYAKSLKQDVRLLTINYGQRHKRELEAAKTIAKLLNAPHEILNIPEGILQGGQLLSKGPLAEGLQEGIAPTFVPGRNAFFLTIAANRAYLADIWNIYIGVSETDYSGYPDCRGDFIESMEQTLSFAFDYEFNIITPLLYKSKKQIVELAASLGDDCWQALAFSHTCYAGTYPPCGKCPACLLRAKGFDEAGYEDPLITFKGGSLLF